MSARPLVENLVVIDDSARFALHVWRYLARSIGIGGSRQISLAEPTAHDMAPTKTFWEGDNPKPLTTGDGRIAVWWVPGDRWLKVHFNAVRKKIDKESRFFLVDMRGQPAGSLLDDRAEKLADGRKEHEVVQLGHDGQYLGREALNLIADWEPDLKERTLMVSSYETGTIAAPSGVSEGDPKEKLLLRIFPKSPETLARLERKISVPWAELRSVPENVLHVLVTGAGFEFRDNRTGTFGLPWTADLLKEMDGPFRGKDDGGRLPIDRSWKDPKILPPILETQDYFTDLDAWWNWLLESELSKLVKGQHDPQARERQKATASLQEREMREAFRQVILRYDRGQMNQSLQAAALGWQAWLTTNYTRFADRALDLLERRGARQDREIRQARAIARNAPDSWEIVSTSIEALSLEREIVHREGGSEESSRYLFKLHGDIAHLQTMATAGYDKELFSMLSVPVDSLHQVYSAAATYLGHVLEKSREDTHLVWHVVGQGLSDWLLLQLIGRVCRYAKRGGIDFVVVGPAPRDAIEKLGGFLRAHLRDRAWRITSHAATAEQYMAQITSSGGLRAPETPTPTWVSEWLSALDPGAGTHLVEWLAPTLSRTA